MHMDFSKCIKSYYSNFKGSRSFATFINIKDIDMGGKNYFAAHEGASLINLKSSAMTITGNLTVIGGKAFEGGGIKLDESSVLYLKEPLEAWFINNTAYQGSAIHAPSSIQFGDTSPPNCSMQILPSHIYSLYNITRLNIFLNFRGNTNTNLNASISFHIPQFNFLCQQVSANLLFNRQTWDYEHSQFAY